MVSDGRDGRSSQPTLRFSQDEPSSVPQTCQTGAPAFPHLARVGHRASPAAHRAFKMIQQMPGTNTQSSFRTYLE